MEKVKYGKACLCPHLPGSPWSYNQNRQKCLVTKQYSIFFFYHPPPPSMEKLGQLCLLLAGTGLRLHCPNLPWSVKFPGTSQDVKPWVCLFINLGIRFRLILSYFENNWRLDASSFQPCRILCSQCGALPK